MDLDSDDDDLFASLGGSLMKNLLADLNDESGSGALLSLEELEQELAHFEDRVPANLTSPSVSNTAASMVIRAQENILSPSLLQNDGESNGAPLDAWSLSLQKFTEASLQDDFLQADVERKAKHSVQSTVSLQQQSSIFNNAEDYDVSEPLLVSPPPGLASNTNDAVAQSLVTQLTTKLETVAVVDDSSNSSFTGVVTPPVPQPHAMPHTPQNSFNITAPKPPPPTPQNSVSVNLGVLSPNSSEHVSGETVHIEVKPADVVISMKSEPDHGISVPPIDATAEPKHVPQLTVQPPVAARNITAMPPPPPPAAVASNRPRTMLYCNPLPDAKSVPAAAIAAKYMTPRDISYVVHSILKPILLHQQQNPSSPFDYERAFFQKTAGVPPSMVFPRNNAVQGRGSAGAGPQGKSLEAEMESRAAKAKNWSTENSVLGRTTKSNVSRPRALIAQPTKEELEEANGKNNNSEQRQRQALWKARIYCDQAYQAFMKVVQTWHLVAGSPESQGLTSAEAAASLQPHLFKLLRCLGLTRNDHNQDVGLSSDLQQQQQQNDQQNSSQPTYFMTNDTALPLLTKLPKGRVLLARILEQALLPPAAVAVMLKPLFQAMYVLPPATPRGAAPNPSALHNSSALAQEHANDRVFAALSHVLQTLPDIPKAEITGSLDVIQEHSSVALQSSIRMQAVHSLLQRGTKLAAEDVEFLQEWKTREQAFLQVLSG